MAHDQRVNLTMDEDHKAALEEAAERDHCSVSEWVRRRIREADPDAWTPREPSNGQTAWNDGAAN